MKILGWFAGVICALLVAVGLVQIVQVQEDRDQDACLQSIVEQLTDRSETLSAATALRDEAFADLVDVLLDPKSGDKERLDAFTELKEAGTALVQARAENRVPDIDERCG